MVWMHRASVLLLFLLATPVWAGPPQKGATPAPPRQDASPPRQKAERPGDVALWNLKSVGLEAARAAAVTQELQQALQRNPALHLLSPQEMKARLQAVRMSLGSPVAEVAAALKVPWILNGTLGGLGEEISLDLKLYDAKGAEIRRVAVNLPPDPKAREGALDEVVVQLLQPEDWKGRLALQVEVEGAQVAIDGNTVGATPLSGTVPLAPGKHIVMISKEGYNEFSTFVVIAYNQPLLLKVNLKDAVVEGLLQEQPRKVEPPKPLPNPAQVVVEEEEHTWGTGRTVAFWGMLAGAAVVGGGLILGVNAKDLQTKIEEKRWTASQAGELQAEIDDGHRRALAANILMIGGGVIAAGSLVLFFVLDGGSEQHPAPALQPVVVPGGAGATFSGRF